ncbi:Apidaecins type 22 [Dufourea novaeangliae]|uniref:Apidaecins type 22 n=1 Tax=Dufourea novaeangliae TaxID=178035 RepID=A0A154P5C1_DUFNO|nr:Apidaecins type 22 [Dufourea novaeangliae]
MSLHEERDDRVSIKQMTYHIFVSRRRWFPSKCLRTLNFLGDKAMSNVPYKYAAVERIRHQYLLICRTIHLADIIGKLNTNNTYWWMRHNIVMKTFVALTILAIVGAAMADGNSRVIDEILELANPRVAREAKPEPEPAKPSRPVYIPPPRPPHPRLRREADPEPEPAKPSRPIYVPPPRPPHPRLRREADAEPEPAYRPVYVPPPRPPHPRLRREADPEPNPAKPSRPVYIPPPRPPHPVSI